MNCITRKRRVGLVARRNCSTTPWGVVRAFSPGSQRLAQKVRTGNYITQPFISNSPLDRIVSVVSDLSGNIFYTLTANSTISVYFPTSNKSVQLSQTIQNLYKLAQEKAPGSPAITPKHFHVIALHVITEEESRSGVQLMAITMNGVRLYFSSSASPYGYYPAIYTRVQRHLQLV